ncbi:MAG: cobalamin B12-binding domain-containing protein [Tepidimonas sp.]|uniref:MerR family transcriptional regulator n=1 Tax=Tepidimonas sp. TaxID=2002775 RepID=UPI00259FDFAE|nr:cobalamin B12-binding domain-containing protein [Tepidimonas sp.]MDM7456925.1 cobalamin B12-binding domain-containing protein [Tepidimonas sp.]
MNTAPASPSSSTGAPMALWAIADVERETGIGKDTLRVWERRYGFPAPQRDERGDRLYDAEQLSRLRLIRRLLDAGYRPGRVVGLPRDALEALAASALAQNLAAPQHLPGSAGEPDHLADDQLAPWMAWLRQDQTLRLREALRSAVRTRGLAQTVEAVVAPLCTAVGHAWLRGEIGVYQEHLFTEVVQATLREAIARTDETHPVGLRPPRVLLTTSPGEQHQLGLLMAECFLALEGCDRLPLGVCTPVAEIIGASERTGADVVALSYSDHASRRDVVETVAQLRQQLAASVELWIGGAGAVRNMRRVPPDVVVLRRAVDAAVQVRLWRQRRGLA